MFRTSCNRAERPANFTRRTACTVLLAAGMLCATARAQIAAAQEFYSQAIAMPAAHAESRAEQLYLALRMAQNCPGRSTEEKQLTSKIKKSLREIDPRAGALLKTQRRGAKQALQAAMKLADAGRVRGATDLLALSLTLSLCVDFKAIAEIRAQQPTANAMLLDLFADSSLPYQGDPWEISEAGITSPPPQGRGQNVTSMLQSDGFLIGNYRLSIEAQTSSFGIALGIQGEGTSYHMLSVVHEGEDSRIALVRFAEDKFTNLAVQPIRLDAADSEGWIGIKITVEEGRISASVNESAPLVFETQENLDGALGFFLAAGNHNQRATSFRHLEIHCIR